MRKKKPIAPDEQVKNQMSVDWRLAKAVYRAWDDYKEGHVDLKGFMFRLKGAIKYTEVDEKLEKKIYGR